MNVIAWTAITSLLLVEGMNMLASAWIVMITTENHVVVLTWPAIMSILLVAGTVQQCSVHQKLRMMEKISSRNRLRLRCLDRPRVVLDFHVSYFTSVI